jgi:hypothetical protein
MRTSLYCEGKEWGIIPLYHLNKAGQGCESLQTRHKRLTPIEDPDQAGNSEIFQGVTPEY